MKATKMGAITKKSASAAIKCRLEMMAKAKKQGEASLSDIARQYGVTPALVSQIKASMMKNGITFNNYDVNKHRGRPVVSTNV